MNLRYRPLFKLLLQHDYFPEGKCPVVDIVPSPATQRVMSALDLRQINRENGIEVFYGERGGSAPLLELDGALRLSFWLRPTDVLFQNYTDLPLSQGFSFVYHASNLAEANTTTFGFSAGGVKRLPLRSPQVRVEGEGASASVVLTDEVDNLVQSRDNPVAGGPDFRLVEDVFTADLSQLPAGQYQMSGVGDPEVFVPAIDGYQQGDVGLLTIYVGDLAEKGTRMLTGGAVSPGEYTVTFGARATRWRYHLIGEDYQNFRISGEDFPGTGPPEQRVLPNQGLATVLASQLPMHLRQRPKTIIELHADRTDGGPSIGPVPLPAAGADRIVPNPKATKGESFFSDIYVYL